MPSWTRTAFLTALLAASVLMPMTPALPADSRVPVVQVAASEGTSRFVPLGIGKSIAIDLPADIKDVLVADPKIANARFREAMNDLILHLVGVFDDVKYSCHDISPLKVLDGAPRRDSKMIIAHAQT